MATKKLKIGIVGCGAIGSTLAVLLQKKFAKNIKIVALCDIDMKRARLLAGKVKEADAVSLEKLIKASDLVVESASAKVSFEIAQKALYAGKEVLVMSVGGILGKEKRLFDLAEKKKTKIFFPSGAVCGLDGIRALSLSKIKKITLTTMKPPQGLKGASYLLKHNISLDGITGDKVVFQGSAMEAVRAFPQNINVVAVLSLAAKGQVTPRVKIVASRSLKRNVHIIEVDSDAAHLKINCENVPSPDNPRTSYLAILSALAVIAGILDPVKIGA